MVNAREAAGQAARKALESAYDGRCDIIEYRDVRTDTAASVTQGLKLFLAPEIRVKPGSKVIVTQNGITGAYSASGEPAVYSTHQEIVLELSGRWA